MYPTGVAVFLPRTKRPSQTLRQTPLEQALNRAVPAGPGVLSARGFDTARDLRQ